MRLAALLLFVLLATDCKKKVIVPAPVPSAVSSPEPTTSAVAPVVAVEAPSQSASAASAKPATSAKPPGVRMKEDSPPAIGSLPTEIVQRIVRQHMGEMRSCYNRGLESNPALKGKVTVKFTIDPTGAVTNAVDGGSTLSDPAVVQCVVKAFGKLQFPQPEGGSVNVVYPITFESAE